MGLGKLTNFIHLAFHNLNPRNSPPKHKVKVAQHYSCCFGQGDDATKNDSYSPPTTTKLGKFSFRNIEDFALDNWKSFSIGSYYSGFFSNFTFHPFLAKFAHADQVLSMIMKKKTIGEILNYKMFSFHSVQTLYKKIADLFDFGKAIICIFDPSYNFLSKISEKRPIIEQM